MTARVGETVLYSLRARCYAHIQRRGLDYHEGQLAGKITTRMTTDIDALSSFFQTGVATTVVSLLTLVGIDVIERIAALPLRFMQPVGERGRPLSAGQRQLVALARAERHRRTGPVHRIGSPPRH